MAPATIEDEDLWLKWFSDTLSKCEEARKANRDFSTNRPIARIGWADVNPYSVLGDEDDYPSGPPCPELLDESDDESDDTPTYHVAPVQTSIAYSPNSPSSASRIITRPPVAWDDLPIAYPDDDLSPIQATKQKVRNLPTTIDDAQNETHATMTIYSRIAQGPVVSLQEYNLYVTLGPSTA
ncbi:unnamed protein product [Aphanomyces euteiches]